jgi:hypothetical protein
VSTTRTFEWNTDHGSWVAIAAQAFVLFALMAVVAGAMLTVARPVSDADATAEGNTTSPRARFEPSSAQFVAGPPGGLLILLAASGSPIALGALPHPIVSTGGPLDINVVHVPNDEARAAFLRAFADADSVCAASACRPTWVVEFPTPR